MWLGQRERVVGGEVRGGRAGLRGAVWAAMRMRSLPQGDGATGGLWAGRDVTQCSVHRVLPALFQRPTVQGAWGAGEEAAGQVQEGGKGGQGHVGLYGDKWADPGFIL